MSMMVDGVPQGGAAEYIGPQASMAGESCSKRAPVKVKFTETEDAQLTELVNTYGSKDWIHISKLMVTRNPRQCRERWNNYLNPDLRTDPWSAEEDKLLDEKFAEYGAKWNKIAKFFTNRSDNNIRNRWMLIARRRAKVVGPHQVSPPTPAPTPILHPSPPMPAVTFKPQPIPLPIIDKPQYVIPIVKELPLPEMRVMPSSFDIWEITPEDFSFIEPTFESDPWSQLQFASF